MNTCVNVCDNVAYLGGEGGRQGDTLRGAPPPQFLLKKSCALLPPLTKETGTNNIDEVGQHGHSGAPDLHAVQNTEQGRHSIPNLCEGKET
jgi:hypothetical protein